MRRNGERRRDCGRRRAIAAFWARLLCFALLCVCALSYVSYILTPKHDYGVSPIMNLYRQKADTVDALVLGTSLAYCGVNTNVLWSEYGVAALCLCTAEQPYWISYAYLKEALLTQSPRLIVLDAKASTYQEDGLRRGRAIMSTFGIVSPAARYEATLASVPLSDARGYMLRLPQVHANYPSVTWEDFLYPPAALRVSPDWKGFIGLDARESHTPPSLVFTSASKRINVKELDYLKLILALASDKGIAVLVVGFPNPDYANDHLYYNAVWEAAEAYGAAHINFNEPDQRKGLRYTAHFADWQHLNLQGSVVFSRLLGDALRRGFDLPDRRGDARYASFDDCLAQFAARYPEIAAMMNMGESGE